MIRFDTKKDYELYNSKIEDNIKLKQENEKLKENYGRIYNENCKLRRKIGQLENNWEKLKEYIAKEYYMYLPLEASAKSIIILIDKMQELEGSDSNVKD